jgi:type IX secretion system PorP/SprF family membrane protein
MKNLTPFLLILLATSAGYAQDIPLFSQKLTQSFLYNPALAGHSHGSVTYAYRSAFARVEGSNRSNYLSFQAPLRQHTFGVGANIFTEKINFLSNTYASLALAYHLELGNDQLLSAGLAGEYNFLRPDYDRIVGDVTDNMLKMLDEGDMDKPDVSFGLHYSHPYFKIGLAANRLVTSFSNDSQTNMLSQYITAQASGHIPLRYDKDVLEPVFVYRKFSSISSTFDLGFYYTYNNLVILGSSARMGIINEFASVENKGIDIVNLTAGLRVAGQVLVGFSYDIYNNSAAPLGNSSEITLRYDFANTERQADFRKQNGSPTNFKGRMKRHKMKKPKNKRFW